MDATADPNDDFGIEAGSSAAAVGAGAGALFGIALGGDGVTGAVVGAAAAPYTSRWVARSWDELRGRGQHQVEAMVTEAAAIAECDLEELLHRARASDNHTGLLADAMVAAADTMFTRKVSALARAVGNGLRYDGAVVDESRLIVRALADLEEPHVRMLSRLPTYVELPVHATTRPRPDGPILGENPIQDSILAVLARNHLAATNEDEVSEQWSAYQLGVAVAELREELTQRRGAVPPRPHAEVRYYRTKFGTLCLRHLEQRA